MLSIPYEGEDATEGDLCGAVGENEYKQPRQQQPPHALENLAAPGTSDGTKMFPCDQVTGCGTAALHVAERKNKGREPRPR